MGKKILSLAFFLIVSSLSAAIAAEVDLEKFIEFRNTPLADSYEEAKLAPKNISPLPWEAYEKENVLKMIRIMYKTAPGLFENPALYGKIPYYRADDKIARALGIQAGQKWRAFAISRSVWFGDIFSAEEWTEGGRTLIHEFTHLVDIGGKISDLAEFRRLVEPRLGKAHAELKKAGLSVKDSNEETSRIAKDAGLSRSYAMTSLQEALACYAEVAYMGEEFTPPAEIDAFIKSRIFSRQASPDPSIPPYIRGFVLREQKKYDESIAALNEALKIYPDFIEARYFLARDLENKGDIDAAINEFTRLLSSTSEYDQLHSDILYMRGLLFEKKGEPEKAFADYSADIEKHPEEPQPYYYRAVIFNRKKEYDKAIADLSRALSIYPNYPDVLFERGLSKYYKKDFDAAIEDFAAAIRILPKYTIAYYYSGLSKLGKKDYNAAMDDLFETIKLNPNFSDAYVVRADCEIAIRDFDKAIEDLDAAIKLQPDYQYAYYRRGLCKVTKKESDGAIADFGLAIKYNSLYIDAYLARASLWMEKKEYDKTIADYNEYFKIVPQSKNAEVYYLRSRALTEKSEYDKALADLNEVIKLQPQNISAYNDRGRIWYKKKDLDRALADFNEVIKISPKELNAHHYRGWVWLEKAEYDKAIDDFSMTKKILPFDSPENYYPRGLALLKKKEYDAALAEFNQALMFSPKNASIYSSRAEAWMAKKEYAKAVADLDTALGLDPKLTEAVKLKARAQELLEKNR